LAVIRLTDNAQVFLLGKQMAKPLAKNRMIVYYNDGGGHGGSLYVFVSINNMFES
jgi:hypothetical protein